MSLSLYSIEETLAGLIEAREAADSDGDSEALKIIDQQIAEYLHDREPAKIDSYCAVIREMLAEAELCKEEAARLSARAKAREAHAERMKANLLFTMQRFDVKQFRTPTNTVTRQGNGGKQKLDCINAENLPAKFVQVTAVMPCMVWGEILELSKNVGIEAASVYELNRIDEAAKREADTDRIREALSKHVPCPECHKGQPIICDDRGSGELSELGAGKCPRCAGTGMVPAEVPGARLLPRGEHVVIK